MQYCENGVVKDPFELFHAHRANLVRVRLWNDARWTKYSDLSDVKKPLRMHARTACRCCWICTIARIGPMANNS